MSPYIKDLFQRVVFSFLFTFLSVFTLSDLSSGKQAAIAGGVAALALVKSWLAKYVGDPNTASF